MIISETPTALSPIRSGVSYTVQNRTKGQNISVCVSASVPDGSESNVFELPTYETAVAKASSGERIYAWVKTGRGFLAFDEES